MSTSTTIVTNPNPTSWLQNLGIAIEVVCPALAFIVVVLRTYIRLDTKSFGWDDGLIVSAMALSIALAVGSIKVMKSLYIGIHYYDVPPFDPTEGLIWIYVVGAVYQPILTLVKQSVLVFLLRFSGVKSGVRYVVWATIIFNTILMVAIFIVVILQCIPIEMNWNPLIKGHCIEQFKFGVAAASLTIMTDIVSVALPFYIFLGLQINKNRKVALIGVFMLGILVTVVSIVRLYFLAQNFNDTSPDKNFSLGFCVSSIECNLAILTASAPALWPLVRRWLPRLKSTNNQSYYGKHKYGVSSHTQQGYIRTTDGPENSIGLKDMSGRRVHTEVRSSRDSDEEILTGTGIMRTTQFTVSTTDSRSHATLSRNFDDRALHSKASSNGSL
ncbi:uncharacterized protein F4807DRAFT_238189 [Annulohypoxylon truncatum]|uniref:uncharacterized protein n=1 Tax=Annulohypoxylon truncatum TaxID=327061 RepID=UPI002007B02A|nr:uncharacterized protein F4807DRAFT_238189 [Annulohypoxylon truncatum]KAI1206127.1 hypothetical protein F4807DRAFT_238189 [Annulohypoxylon truncatum]